MLIGAMLLLVGLLSATDILVNNSNIYCYFAENGRLHCVRTTDFGGQVGFKATGIYTHVGDLFMLHSDVGLYRLIFYCKNGTLVTTTDTEVGVVGGYEFCETTPLTDGGRINVIGTLITPSELNNTFAGDLYVFELTIGA